MENITKVMTQDELNQRWGTSFHNAIILASVDELRKLFGEETEVCLDKDEKVQHEWLVKKGDEYFTIYDWKEYRNYSDDEIIYWHIGSKYDTEKDTAFSIELLKLIKEVRNSD